MKVTPSHLYLVALLCLFQHNESSYVVSAADDVAVRTVLSHGRSVKGKTCSNREWNTIVESIEREAIGHRNLREQDDRSLYYYTAAVPSYCEACCSGFQSGYCFLVFIGCMGYVPRPRGRDLAGETDVDESSEISQGSLLNSTTSTTIEEHSNVVVFTKKTDEPNTGQPSTTAVGLRKLSSSSNYRKACREKIRNIDDALDALYPKLSTTCRDVVHQSRDFTCYSPTDLDILRFKLWDGQTDRVIDNKFSRWKEEVCSSKQVNFQAMVGALVNKVAFRVVGSNGFKSSNTETGGPFMSFGDNGKGNIYGKRLNVGSYVLVATPDGDSSKAQTVKFKVISC